MAQYFENKYFKSKKFKMAKPLATNTDTVVHSGQKEIYRTLLHQMRFVAKDFTLLREVLEKRKPRIKYCGHALTVESGTVNIVKQTNGNVSYNGVASCSNYWRCPVCAYKIVQEKQKFLFGLAKEHGEKGGKMGFVTLTVRHNRRTRLQTSLDKITGNYRKFQQSKWFRKFKKEIQGQVKSLEITFSQKNGWHPHLHILYFYDSKINDADIVGFQKELLKRWCNFESKEFGKNDALLKAQDQKICYDQNITDYTSKWDMSYEMTKGNIKSSKGLTVMTALGKLAVQDYEDINQKRLLQGLYSEYIEATYRKNFLTLSPSLRKLYAEYFETEEKTDEEICTSSEVAEILMKFSIPVWKTISRHQLQPLVLSVYRKPFEREERLRQEYKEIAINQYNISEKRAEKMSLNMWPEAESEKIARSEGIENVVQLLTRFKKLQNIAVEIDKNDCPIIL